MLFCEFCGSAIPDGQTICPSCGKKTGYCLQSTQSSPEASPSLKSRQQNYDNYKQAENASSTSNSVATTSSLPKLAENEKVVRSYCCSNIRHPRCTGFLSVTNKRVIFHARGTTSRLTKEVSLDSISGLDCFYGKRIKFLQLIIGIILIIAGTAIAYETENSTLLIIALVVGIIIVVLSIRSTFFLSVFSSKAMGSPISIGEGIRSAVGNGVIYSLQSRPTADTGKMLHELGALVQDLQTLGDLALEKWK